MENLKKSVYVIFSTIIIKSPVRKTAENRPPTETSSLVGSHLHPTRIREANAILRLIKTSLFIKKTAIGLIKLLVNQIVSLIKSIYKIERVNQLYIKPSLIFTTPGRSYQRSSRIKINHLNYTQISSQRLRCFNKIEIRLSETKQHLN